MGKFTRFESASAAFGRSAPTEKWSDVYYSEPARAASVGSDVAVPALQALISGVVAGAVVLALCVAFGWALRIAGAVALAVLAITWLLLLIDHRRLLWAVENLTRADLDHDGAVGEPVTLRLEVKHSGNGGRRFDFLHLGVSDAAFLQWASAVVAGRSLAVSSWVGRGQGFSRSEYDAMLAELERSEIVEKSGKGTNAAWVLTPEGREALRECVREYARGALPTVAYSQGGEGGQAPACGNISTGGKRVAHSQSGEGGQAVGYIVLLLGALVLLVLGWRFIGDAVDAARMAANAQAVEAQAALVTAQTALSEAQARIAEANAAEAQAENDQLLHEAAAYSVKRQADLVTYYAVRGDVRACLALLSVVAVLLLLIAARVLVKRLGV